ncbi:hypothetical protein BST61_g10195 [Cercospora zeina]
MKAAGQLPHRDADLFTPDRRRPRNTTPRGLAHCNMASMGLLSPTLHIEVLMNTAVSTNKAKDIRRAIQTHLNDTYWGVSVDQEIEYQQLPHANLITRIDVADYTGPPQEAGCYVLAEVQLDIVIYTLRNHEEARPRRRISQPAGDDEGSQARIVPLPHDALKDEWASLIYGERLPSQLLRYLSRMLVVMKQPSLNLSLFNWNRLCLLHGPPGSGKSTLCRALAQKLSIRLSAMYPQAVLMEVNTTTMLSKYFGESGKLIASLFDKIHGMAQSSTTLVCVVIDEIETIAGSREKANAGGECSDGVRATNQLLTALDRLRALPNVVVLCTSNLLGAIDPAFLDRVDIKQFVPSPSQPAIYNIFRSCLNALVVGTAAKGTSCPSWAGEGSPTDPPPECESPDEPPEPSIPTLEEMQIAYHDQPQAACQRLWAIARKCEGFSGRRLRRLPIHGLAMYTWCSTYSLDDAVTALEAAVDEELGAKSSSGA